MRIDHEELIARNPALSACAFWYVARRHAETSRGTPPTLPVFVVSAGLLFHSATVEKVARMQFDSGFLKAIVDRPELIAGLQGRVERNASAALTGLQAGVSARLLDREGGHGLPTFRAIGGGDLPAALRDHNPAVAQIMAAAKRLGAWFAMEPFPVLQRQLNVEF